MTRTLVTAMSALVLLSGTALAQSTGSTSQTTTTTVPSRTTVTTSPGSGSASQAGAMHHVSANQLMDKEIVGTDGSTVGTVKDVILDTQSQQVRNLVVELEEGDKTIALPINQTRIDSQKGQLTLQGVDKRQLQAMQEFQYEGNVVALGGELPKQ